MTKVEATVFIQPGEQCDAYKLVTDESHRADTISDLAEWAERQLELPAQYARLEVVPMAGDYLLISTGPQLGDVEIVGIIKVWHYDACPGGDHGPY